MTAPAISSGSATAFARMRTPRPCCRRCSSPAPCHWRWSIRASTISTPACAPCPTAILMYFPAAFDAASRATIETPRPRRPPHRRRRGGCAEILLQRRGAGRPRHHERRFPRLAGPAAGGRADAGADAAVGIPQGRRRGEMPDAQSLIGIPFIALSASHRSRAQELTITSMLSASSSQPRTRASEERTAPASDSDARSLAPSRTAAASPGHRCWRRTVRSKLRALAMARCPVLRQFPPRFAPFWHNARRSGDQASRPAPIGGRRAAVREHNLAREQKKNLRDKNKTRYSDDQGDCITRVSHAKRIEPNVASESPPRGRNLRGQDQGS